MFDMIWQPKKDVPNDLGTWRLTNLKMEMIDKMIAKILSKQSDWKNSTKPQSRQFSVSTEGYFVVIDAENQYCKIISRHIFKLRGIVYKNI